ncbi:hypothetical protein ACFV84_33440 [Kitasatospora sp. NPDC059811]|uniref:hypothetical protein n=1 Tax=Streptomycetaceae TaxID=2062 RepID=UPI0007AF22A5|nr:hypothetical protein [Streptomyces sp. MJM8645]
MPFHTALSPPPLPPVALAPAAFVKPWPPAPPPPYVGLVLFITPPCPEVTVSRWPGVTARVPVV